MTDPVQWLQQVASTLQREGKTPSLALFRARLAGKLTPQQLFSAYQQWRNNPIYSDNTPAEPEPAGLQQQDNTAEDINARLARIEAKLDVLLSKLEH